MVAPGREGAREPRDDPARKGIGPTRTDDRDAMPGIDTAMLLPGRVSRVVCEALQGSIPPIGLRIRYEMCGADA